jgi:hypothetical protein
VEEPSPEPGSEQQETRICPVCGTKFFATADSGFCPVCILHGATGGESAAAKESGQASGAADSPGETEGASQARRFEHYEVMLDDEGRPIELGRGAMGVTMDSLNVVSTLSRREIAHEKRAGRCTIKAVGEFHVVPSLAAARSFRRSPPLSSDSFCVRGGQCSEPCSRLAR